MRKFILLFLIIFTKICLFAEIKIISPVPGNWANKQMLLIDTADGGDYFYSLNGEDPDLAGFAYDGPVLIDMTGNITVKITRGFEEKTEINFFVEHILPENDDERAFVYSFSDTGILNYFAGSEINIPSTFKYSFENMAESFNPGRRISYSEKCILSRYIPCTVTDGKQSWRFILRTHPKSTGKFSRRDLPFRINNWNIIEFLDNNLIFKIDNEYWKLPDSPRILDRTESHVIFWQSLEYNPGNPVEFYEIPPLPLLKTEKNSDDSISFFLEGDDSYSMTILSNDSNYNDLYKEFCLDTFPGDYIKDSVEIAVYSDSYYQGSFYRDYEIDRRMVFSPVFTSSNQGFHARGDVKLNVKTSGNSLLYVAVSEPMELESGDYSADSDLFKSVIPEDFKYVGKTTDFILQAESQNPVYFKVRAYSVSGSMKSSISEYSVIIDSYSFYCDSRGNETLADGSKDFPFTSFSQAFKSMQNLRSVKLFIAGNVKMPEGVTEIGFNFEIKGLENALLEFSGNSELHIKNSSLSIDNCRIKGKTSSNMAPSLINLHNSVMSLKNCDVYFSGVRNATFVDSNDSVFIVKDSAVTVQSPVYASFINAENSKISGRNCNVAVVSDTAVCFSIRKSKLSLDNSLFRVSGTIGRIAELFNSQGDLSFNTFNADLKRNSTSIKPIFFDEHSDCKETGSKVQGF